jgi:hypothetical protein
VQWLDFDVFMQGPEEGARKLAGHLDLEWDDRTDRLLIKGGTLGSYSKAGKAVDFSNEQRLKLLEKFKGDNPDLIKSATAWLDRVAGQTPAIASWLDGIGARSA